MTNEYQRPPVRVALMGLGRSMFGDHYPVFKAHPALFKVVAACDLDSRRLEDMRRAVARHYKEKSVDSVKGARDFAAKVKDVRDLTLSVRRLAETRVVRIRVNPEAKK